MNKLRTRHWALISHGALQGKTTFLAANSRPPLLVVDTDGRFDAVEALVDGPVFYPSQVIDPLELAEEIMDLYTREGIKSILWDSLTKLYSLHARLGFMRGRAGRSKSRASELVDKSNAMTIARDLAMLGTDVYYTWHTMEGRNHEGKSEIRAMVSDVERNRLETSINVTLEFLEVDGIYGARIQNARDFGGRKANAGFTIWDKPGNYWRGAANWLEELMYTSFTGKPEAVSWVSRELNLEIDEAEGVYDHLKESIEPETSALMWVNLIQHVRDLQKGDTVNPKGDTGDKGVKGDTEPSQIGNNAPPQEYAPENPPTDDAQMDDLAGIEETREESPNDTQTDDKVDESASPADKDDTGGDKGDTVQAEIFPAGTGNIPQMRQHLVEIAEKRGNSTVLLGQVVYAILTAVPGRYAGTEGVIEELGNYPDLPDGYTWELDKVVTLSGGQKFFDFAVRE
jgi:hypothetical protein